MLHMSTILYLVLVGTGLPPTAYRIASCNSARTSTADLNGNVEIAQPSVYS